MLSHYTRPGVPKKERAKHQYTTIKITCNRTRIGWLRGYLLVIWTFFLCCIRDAEGEEACRRRWRIKARRWIEEIQSIATAPRKWDDNISEGRPLQDQKAANIINTDVKWANWQIIIYQLMKLPKNCRINLFFVGDDDPASRYRNVRSTNISR